jgi:hypothetical protein
MPTARHVVTLGKSSHDVKLAHVTLSSQRLERYVCNACRARESAQQATQ